MRNDEEGALATEEEDERSTNEPKRSAAQLKIGQIIVILRLAIIFGWSRLQREVNIALTSVS